MLAFFFRFVLDFSFVFGVHYVVVEYISFQARVRIFTFLFLNYILQFICTAKNEFQSSRNCSYGRAMIIVVLQVQLP